MKRRRALVIATALGCVGLAVTIGYLVFGVGRNKEEISKRPTKEQLYRAEVKSAKDNRRICHVLNGRFAALGRLLAAQRPSAQTTAYYADHPDELAKAQSYFDRVVKVLSPQNCRKRYPLPKRPVISTQGVIRPKRHPRVAQGVRAPPRASPKRLPVRKGPQAGLNPPKRHLRVQRPGPTHSNPSPAAQPPPVPQPVLPEQRGPPQDILNRICTQLPHLIPPCS